MHVLLSVRDFKIGNWVNLPRLDNTFRSGIIWDISFNQVIVKFDDSVLPMFIPVQMVHTLAPVELTREWMTRAHFTRLSCEEEFERMSFGFLEVWVYKNGDIIPVWQRHPLGRFEHVHRFQNLYSVLTGKELWI